jgi:hypothetical protein
MDAGPHQRFAHIFTKPAQSPISIPVHHNKVKPVYVRKIKNICEGKSDQGEG